MPRSRVQQLFSGSLQRFSEKQLEVGASKVTQKSQKGNRDTPKIPKKASLNMFKQGKWMNMDEHG